MADAIDLLWEKATDDRNWLEHLSLSTLSRILGGGIKRMPRRKKFNIIVLAVLDMEWSMAGRQGPAPGFQDVQQVWGEWQQFRRKELAPAPDLSDPEQHRYEVAYGEVGTALLGAARSSEPAAALTLGVLRILDGHHGEGEAWLRSAGQYDSRGLALLDSRSHTERKSTAIGCALELAASLDGALNSTERRVLLLERAAQAGSREAALLLTAHYDSLGETGHAQRWRVAGEGRSG